MRKPVSAVAALVAVVASVMTAPAAQAAPVASTVVVSYTGETSFATVPGEPYLITVTGRFEWYDGDNVPRFWRSGDCGWWFDDPLTRSEAVTVDGHPAGCRDQPYSETHTYQWTEFGTGAPFRFSIEPSVVVGALTFTVTGARAQVPHGVSGFCVPRRVATPLLDYVPVVVEAGAVAGEPESAVSTYVVCDVTGVSGESAHLRFGLPGPAVETADRMIVPHGDRLTVCSYAGASWDDGVTVTSTTQCYQTVLS